MKQERKFPVTVVDNFYDDPDSVREFALSLPFDNEKDNYRYPGKRTEDLHLISKNFFDFSCEKLFSLFYEFEKHIRWTVKTNFQIIHPYDNDKMDIKNKGWIHRDNSILTAVVYLTPGADIDSGTKIFKLKDGMQENEYLQEARFKLYGQENTIEDDYVKKFTEHSSCFEETVSVKNYYNRLIVFDCADYHAVENLYSKVPRLTQVFFVNGIETEMQPPLHRGNYLKFIK